jgi:hypothetical protein
VFALACAVAVIGMPRVVAETYGTSGSFTPITIMGGPGGAILNMPPVAATLGTIPATMVAPVVIREIGNTAFGNMPAPSAGGQKPISNDMAGAHAVNTKDGSNGPSLTGVDRGPTALTGTSALAILGASSGGCTDAGMLAQRGSALDSPGVSGDELDVGGMSPLTSGVPPGGYTCK